MHRLNRCTLNCSQSLGLWSRIQQMLRQNNNLPSAVQTPKPFLLSAHRPHPLAVTEATKKKTKKQKTDLLRRLCLLFKTRISKCSGKGWNRFPGHIWSCLLVVVLLPHPSRHVNLPLLTVHTQADGAPDVKHGLQFANPWFKSKPSQGWGCSSAEKHLPSMCEVMGSIPTAKMGDKSLFYIFF